MNKNEENRVLSLISLCQKAGKVASGEDTCEAAIRGGQAFLVLLSSDASATTRKKFTNRCHYYGVPLATLPFNKEQLGHTIGKALRSCAAICEEGFAKRILEYPIQIEKVLEEEANKADN